MVELSHECFLLIVEVIVMNGYLSQPDESPGYFPWKTGFLFPLNALTPS